ncbi:hypothetical protein CISIN_1g047160mg, partial [Citrus sinensis]
FRYGFNPARIIRVHPGPGRFLVILPSLVTMSKRQESKINAQSTMNWFQVKKLKFDHEAQGRQKSSLKKGALSPEEDQKLINYVTSRCLLRCGKSCRLCWRNYQRPDINRDSFTQEEDEIIIKLHQQLRD